MVYASRCQRASGMGSASRLAGPSQATRCVSWSSHSNYHQSYKLAQQQPTRLPASLDPRDSRKLMTVVMPLRSGALLGSRYQIVRLIGQGGMGAVYEVIDQRLNARVALKQIIRTSPALREAFEREAKLLANLRHESLPGVSDYFSEADSDFIVMEYIGGEDLA